MKAANVHVGDRYAITISGKPAVVVIDQVHFRGGWYATNERTHRQIILKSARRLKYNVTLRDYAIAYYADLAAGRTPWDGTGARATIAGDYDGCEREIERARLQSERQNPLGIIEPAQVKDCGDNLDASDCARAGETEAGRAAERAADRGGPGPEEGILYPNVQVELTGRDGNAFAIIGACIKAARRAGIGAGPIAAFQVEATSGDYDHLLATCMRWFDVS